jgi:hypothetical protein
VLSYLISVIEVVHSVFTGACLVGRRACVDVMAAGFVQSWRV